MSRPASAEHGSVFDFASLTRELREEESYAREGHTARTLLRAPDLRVILVVVRAGSTISEHHAQVTSSTRAFRFASTSSQVGSVSPQSARTVARTSAAGMSSAAANLSACHSAGAFFWLERQMLTIA